MTNTKADVLIVGAGLSGLIAAHVLTNRGLQVLMVDKGRSVGGRLATRRVGEGLADHGAQFFTVRSPDFGAWVERWRVDGLVYQWSDGFSDGSASAADGHPRYAVRGGMNALAKHLANALGERATIQTNVKIAQITSEGDGWMAVDEAGVSYKAKALLMTAPVPQSLALAGDMLTPDDRAALERIQYAPCVAGIFRVAGDTRLPAPGALQQPDAPITWIADNQRKGISPREKVITVHAGGEVSRELWDAPEATSLKRLRDALLPYLDSPESIFEGQVKKWRYALPTVLHPDRYLVAVGEKLLAFAGDAFGEARVEGAALSGLAAGEALADRLA